jgi:RNA polymerase sigma-70 factor (ECF subfamily)
MFEAGTILQAWLSTILRNGYFSAHWKRSREVEDGEGVHAASMITIPDQEDRLAVQDLSAALEKLPYEQREAIILGGAEGLSYDDAAEALGVKVGTIESRVSRARTWLAELIGETDHESGVARHAGS